MLRPIVAVEEGLSNIANIIEAEGYNVVELSLGTAQVADAIVITGIDNNMMNIQDIEYDVPVINASGKTPAEIVENLYDFLLPTGEDVDYYFEYGLADEAHGFEGKHGYLPEHDRVYNDVNSYEYLNTNEEEEEQDFGKNY